MIKIKVNCIILIFILIFVFCIPHSISESNNYLNDKSIENIIKIEDRFFSNRYINIDFEKNYYDSDIILSKPIIIDTPDYFSWMDFDNKDWTTFAKDQGNCGSCWDFAAVGALESIICIRENNADLNIDLSEQYVLSCLPFAGSCGGGLARRAYFYINQTSSTGNNCNGIIPEFCMPYQADDEVECLDKCEDWEDFLIPIVNHGYWYPDGSPNDIELIKSQIFQYGPVVTSMLATYYIHGADNLEDWGWDHHDPDDYYAYPGPYDSSNHQVVIVGWKDDPLIGNGGYWIVKNSFSEEWGYDGFFNIEYGSLNIDSGVIDWVDYNPDLFNNWKPIANSGGIYYGSVDENLMIDGSNSFDHEGNLVLYEWDLGDGITKNDISFLHKYDEKGIYPITLTVTDNEGNIDIDNSWVFIDESNSAPNVPEIKGPSKGKNSTSYKYSFSSLDVDGDNVFYYVVWGDTYWEGWWEGWIGPYSSDEKVILENSWVEDGNYTVRVKAKDIYGDESDWAKLDVSMPKKSTFKNFIINYFNEFPLLFKLLNIK